ncbi:MAG: hypothetical protein K0Q66_1859 [Chitinophagaceae bacterium]|nr:hypothetical protein [Chitinophagaceae bacterium]
MLHEENEYQPEYEGLYQEEEWSSFTDAAKKYATAAKDYVSPFFSWVGGMAPGGTTTPSYPKAPTEQQLVLAAIAAGQRDENALTNTVFNKRHPELGGRALQKGMPNFSTLSGEWISIRDTIVRPALRAPSYPVTPSVPSTGGGKVSLQTILNAMNRKGYVVYEKPYQLNIVGVRANNPTPNSFDDSINVFYRDNTGTWQFKSNPATTDPGLHYLKTPMNPAGTAIVLPGQYINSHKIGLHRGEYTALVQQNNVKVIRDTNKDSRLDFGNTNVVNGVYGINIHRATSNGTSKVVDRYSAGCQVFSSSADFAAFIAQCEKHRGLHGNNFTYTLLEEGDL